MDDISDNSFGSMKNISSAQEQYGNLIKNRFYSMPYEFRILQNISIIGLFIIILFLVGGILSLFIVNRFMDWVNIGLLFVVLLMTIFTLAIYIRREQSAISFVSTFFKGDIAWDLYENGIFARKSISYIPFKRAIKFFNFNDISKVYITLNDSNAIVVRDLIKAGEKKFDERRNKKWNDSDSKSDNEYDKMVKGCMWFVDINGNIMPFVIVKEWLKDPIQFESILRQRVNDIE